MKINNFKKILYPHEHGAWGFFLEPFILCLLIAFSLKGVIFTLSSLLFFISIQPLRLIISENYNKVLKKGAYFIGTIYIIFALVLFVISLENSLDENIIYVLLTSIILFSIYFILTLVNKDRTMLGAMSAPLSIAIYSLIVLLLDNWSLFSTSILGLILMGRIIPTVLYINVKLKLLKQQPHKKNLVYFFELFFITLILALAYLSVVPYLSIIAIFVLFVRSIWGFMPSNQFEKIKILGIKEFIYGLVYVILNAIGYWINI